MIGGCAQGHLGTAILLGGDHGPTAQATRQHLSESTIQGPHLLDLERDLCRVHQLTADQGVLAPVLAGLLAGRDLFLLASEVPQASV